MDDQLADKLESMIEGTSHEGDMDWAEEKFNESLTTVEERLLEDLDDDQKNRMALQFMRSDLVSSSRQSYGTEMELHILGIGRRSQEWNDKDNGGKKDVVIAYGTVHAPHDDFPGDVSGDVAEAVFILDTTRGVDAGELMSQFEAGATLKGTFAVSEADDIAGMLRCEATENTVVEATDLDTIPVSTRDERNGILRTRIPETTIAEAPGNLSAFDEETGYAHDFGGDLRRINANVSDVYINDDETFGKYVLMDDSALPDELEESVMMGEQQTTPGLQALSFDPKYHIKYGEQSQLDVYGYLRTDDDGCVIMQVVGVMPIMPMPMDGDDASTSNVNSSEETI